MKITWLGQAGLLFDNGKVKIMVDPYLSNSVEQIEPHNVRRVPVDERFFDIRPDVMIFTHDHLDHFDPETAPRFLSNTQKQITVLCPSSVWQKARAYGNRHNYVQFNRGTEWTEKDVRFTAIFAAHSDPYAIGILIEDLKKRKNYYVTGDTLYHRDVFGDLPAKIDAVFLPINGVGNNLNRIDAERFAERIDADTVVPLHFGMFDSIFPDGFRAKRVVIPQIYQEIKI